jgi:transcription elongation factor
MFTRSSVHCADRIVAHSSWNGPLWRSAHNSSAVPGYAAASKGVIRLARSTSAFREGRRAPAFDAPAFDAPAFDAAVVRAPDPGAAVLATARA